MKKIRRLRSDQSEGLEYTELKSDHWNVKVWIEGFNFEVMRDISLLMSDFRQSGW